MQLSDYDYHLPEELIAQFPPETRGDSRLLYLDSSHPAKDLHFSSFIDLLRADDLLVFNNTRVIPARMYGQKLTGGKLEILVERMLTADRVLAHIRSSKSPKPGSQILVENTCLSVIARQDALFELQSESIGFAQLMEQHGHMPLPPYIEREDQLSDASRYQTVFARCDGAVAAPTAGLHFTDDLLQKIRDKGIEIQEVTLHVGAGTFQPVKVQNLDEHVMHSEWLEVSEDVALRIAQAKQQGRRIVAVGTTAVRSLESAAKNGNIQAYSGDTQLFIRPGYRFNAVDVMITNFHLPQSTLLMLVSAFSGYERMKAAYQHAIEQKYRFFSYGDAMFLERSEN